MLLRNATSYVVPHAVCWRIRDIPPSPKIDVRSLRLPAGKTGIDEEPLTLNLMKNHTKNRRQLTLRFRCKHNYSKCCG